MARGAPRPGSGPGLSRNSPVVSGHHRAPDVRWNCVNSQLYRQLQRLSHPGPPSRVTISIGSDHPGHQVVIVPDITTHGHNNQQSAGNIIMEELGGEDPCFLLMIIEFQKIAQGYQKSLQWNVKSIQFMRRAWKDAFKYSCFTFYWSLSHLSPTQTPSLVTATECRDIQ